jgi:hypothetical protein
MTCEQSATADGVSPPLRRSVRQTRMASLGNRTTPREVRDEIGALPEASID